MNERQTKKENKKLVKEFPFLLPRNRWTGKVPKDYDYSYTELDDMPIGWRKAFGIALCAELKEALIKGNILNKYRISQIKEKFGELRWYDFGNTEEGFKIIDKYSDLSRKTCIDCGKDATKISKGWISPYCDGCIGDRSYYMIGDDEA